MWRALVLIGSCCLALQALAQEGEALRELYQPHRADAQGVVAGEVPAALRLLPGGGPDAWPDPARAALERSVRDAWGPGRILGAVHPGVGLLVAHPLVTTRRDARVLLPVIEAPSLPLRGALALPPDPGPRRVVVLLDASSSANARVIFRDPGGRAERVPVLEAERRALELLIDGLDTERVELGVIAFGESTRGVVAPGASREELRESLARFRREQPEGEGRTDTVCALWLARDWLDAAPGERSREIVLLTDGDLPDSGRFHSCDRARSKAARAACEARRNPVPCPASRRFRRADGESDLVQLASFARRSRRHLSVHALVFERDRAARSYRKLAEATGGALVRVPSAGAIAAALPALVSRQIRGVRASNLDTGESTPNLLQGGSARFEGTLGLRPGPNDIELRVMGARDVEGLYRYRVWHAPAWPETYLADLRERNRSLGLRLDALVADTRDEVQGRKGAESGDERGSDAPASATRALAVVPEAPPAAPLP